MITRSEFGHTGRTGTGQYRTLCRPATWQEKYDSLRAGLRTAEGRGDIYAVRWSHVCLARHEAERATYNAYALADMQADRRYGKRLIAEFEQAVRNDEAEGS